MDCLACPFCRNFKSDNWIASPLLGNFALKRVANPLNDEIWGAMIRGRGTFSTFKSFNLTYHAHTTCRHGYFMTEEVKVKVDCTGALTEVNWRGYVMLT